MSYSAQTLQSLLMARKNAWSSAWPPWAGGGLNMLWHQQPHQLLSQAVGTSPFLSLPPEHELFPSWRAFTCAYLCLNFFLPCSYLASSYSSLERNFVTHKPLLGTPVGPSHSTLEGLPFYTYLGCCLISPSHLPIQAKKAGVKSFSAIPIHTAHSWHRVDTRKKCLAPICVPQLIPPSKGQGTGQQWFNLKSYHYPKSYHNSSHTKAQCIKVLHCPSVLNMFSVANHCDKERCMHFCSTAHIPHLILSKQFINQLLIVPATTLSSFKIHLQRGCISIL